MGRKPSQDVGAYSNMNKSTKKIKLMMKTLFSNWFPPCGRVFVSFGVKGLAIRTENLT